MLASTIELLSGYSKDITELDLANKDINGSLDFINFKSLIKLDCSHTEITSLDNLPNSLIELNCSHTEITSLDNLPNSLIKLNCSYTKISSLDNLPNSLIELDCSNTKITSLECKKKS